MNYESSGYKIQKPSESPLVCYIKHEEVLFVAKYLVKRKKLSSAQPARPREGNSRLRSKRMAANRKRKRKVL